MKILDQTSTHLTLQHSEQLILLSRLFCGVCLVIGIIVLIFNAITEQYIPVYYISGILALFLALLGGIGIFLTPHKTFCFDVNQNKLTIKSQRLLGKSISEYPLNDMTVRVKRHVSTGKNGNVLFVFYDVFLKITSNSKKIYLSGRGSGNYNYIEQRDEALEFAELIRSFINTSHRKPPHQQASSSLKQEWDIYGENSLKILQHTPTNLILKDSERVTWLVRLMGTPFLIFGCLGLLLYISENAFPNLFIIFILVLGIIFVFLPSTRRVEIDKHNNMLTLKVKRFLYVNKTKYSLDDVRVSITKKNKKYANSETKSWGIILETSSSSKIINLFSSNLTRYAALEIVDLIENFTNKNRKK
ncbi:MAG: hypothetical protein RIG63_28040 [Coleofasciculus chthonoplastes F3-SA18-01]|uniref:hypothetical protein n=1 Tax=Coleofasciculus chthonoplastes TaxID=64178 RepID=UPI0032F59101